LVKLRPEALPEQLAAPEAAQELRRRR